MLVKTRSYCLEQAATHAIENFQWLQYWHLALSNSCLGNPHRPGRIYRIVLVCQKRTRPYSLQSMLWPRNFLYPTRPRVPVTIPEARQRQSELQTQLRAVPITVTLKESAAQFVDYLTRLDEQGQLSQREWAIDYALMGTLKVTADLPTGTVTFSQRQVPLYPMLLD